QSDENRSRHTLTMQEHTIKNLKGIAIFAGVASISLFSLNYPVLAQRACVRTDAGQKVCGQLLPGGSSVPLEGNYSLTWAAKPGTYCEAGAIQQLTISSDGLMQGVYNVDQRVTFNGRVDSDGTWSGALSRFGYSFKGNLRDGKLTGTYMRNDTSLAPCQGVLEGYKIPGKSR
ncbi:MAG TPA: hypothetical protein V6C85_01230, partial [Allocoleopsis sp.]